MKTLLPNPDGFYGEFTCEVLNKNGDKRSVVVRLTKPTISVEYFCSKVTCFVDSHVKFRRLSQIRKMIWFREFTTLPLVDVRDIVLYGNPLALFKAIMLFYADENVSFEDAIEFAQNNFQKMGFKTPYSLVILISETFSKTLK